MQLSAHFKYPNSGKRNSGKSDNAANDVQCRPEAPPSHARDLCCRAAVAAFAAGQGCGCLCCRLAVVEPSCERAERHGHDARERGHERKVEPKVAGPEAALDVREEHGEDSGVRERAQERGREHAGALHGAEDAGGGREDSGDEEEERLAEHDAHSGAARLERKVRRDGEHDASEAVGVRRVRDKGGGECGAVPVREEHEARVGDDRHDRAHQEPRAEPRQHVRRLAEQRETRDVALLLVFLFLVLVGVVVPAGSGCGAAGDGGDGGCRGDEDEGAEAGDGGDGDEREEEGGERGAAREEALVEERVRGAGEAEAGDEDTKDDGPHACREAVRDDARGREVERRAAAADTKVARAEERGGRGGPRVRRPRDERPHAERARAARAEAVRERGGRAAAVRVEARDAAAEEVPDEARVHGRVQRGEVRAERRAERARVAAERAQLPRAQRQHAAPHQRRRAPAPHPPLPRAPVVLLVLRHSRCCCCCCCCIHTLRRGVTHSSLQ